MIWNNLFFFKKNFLAPLKLQNIKIDRAMYIFWIIFYIISDNNVKKFKTMIKMC